MDKSGLWCKWYARWTENPKVLVRLQEVPHRSESNIISQMIYDSEVVDE